VIILKIKTVFEIGWEKVFKCCNGCKRCSWKYRMYYSD